jgi:predicted DNA-binding protein YlxM (UPF0122 family)
MELKLYWKLGTQSRRAIKRKYKSYGRLYTYKPRADLLDRLSEEFNISRQEVYDQLIKEREYIFKHLIHWL